MKLSRSLVVVVVSLVLAGLSFAPVYAYGKAGKGCPWKDEAKLRLHLKEHVAYPATGKQIKEACVREMPDEFTKEERACVGRTLSDKKTYQSDAEVLSALGVKSAPSAAAKVRTQ